MRHCYRPAYPESSTHIRKSPGIYTGRQGDDRQQQYGRLNIEQVCYDADETAE